MPAPAPLRSVVGAKTVTSCPSADERGGEHLDARRLDTVVVRHEDAHRSHGTDDRLPFGSHPLNTKWRADEFGPSRAQTQVSLPKCVPAFTRTTVTRNDVGVSSDHVATLDQPSPHWSLEGCCNFRDLGGYRAAGGTLRPRRLFRSDSLAAASATDRAQLAALRLRDGDRPPLRRRGEPRGPLCRARDRVPQPPARRSDRGGDERRVA